MIYKWIAIACLLKILSCSIACDEIKVLLTLSEMKEMAEPAKNKQKLVLQVFQITSLKEQLYFSLKLNVEFARTLTLSIQKFIPDKLIYQIIAVV